MRSLKFIVNNKAGQEIRQASIKKNGRLAAVRPDPLPSVPDLLEAELNARVAILNNTSMVTITDAQGTIIYANDLFCSVTGFTREKIIGKTHAIIRHPDLPNSVVSSIWTTIQQGDPWQGTIKSRNRRGGDFWANTTVAAVLENSVPVRYVWVMHDITEFKQTQANLYEAKQREDQQLLDNVKDASRIHASMMPSEEDFKSPFPSSFIIYSPKQNVSGDFYWFLRMNDESVIALGDSTGHGVAAAFVSLIALSSLKHIVCDMRVTEPGLVLSALNGLIFRMLEKQNGSALSESVDMTFCRYNHVTRKLQYICANSRAYIVRKGNTELLEHTSMSIGSLLEGEFEIPTAEITLEAGDRIFLMSDGIVDQFGGRRDKRLGSKYIKALLTLTSRMSMVEQKTIIARNFLRWKGGNEQTDDLSFIAFEVE
ncbi:MAG TPA: SpoIIE family protein phosphatase [Bacteroidia bacterium]|nr:SpoIIE family protein phosphatase [Bacteroidia bacterium]